MLFFHPSNVSKLLSLVRLHLGWLFIIRIVFIFFLYSAWGSSRTSRPSLTASDLRHETSPPRPGALQRPRWWWTWWVYDSRHLGLAGTPADNGPLWQSHRQTPSFPACTCRVQHSVLSDRWSLAWKLQSQRGVCCDFVSFSVGALAWCAAVEPSFFPLNFVFV